jgi:hypothetical protein
MRNSYRQDTGAQLVDFAVLSSVEVAIEVERPQTRA